jgi:predicted Zn-ribbon and HTH transcriptional regulator
MMTSHIQRSDKIYYSFDLRDFCTNMSGSVYCCNECKKGIQMHIDSVKLQARSSKLKAKALIRHPTNYRVSRYKFIILLSIDMTASCSNCKGELIISSKVDNLYLIKTSLCANCGQKQEEISYNIDKIELEPIIDISYLQNILLQKINEIEDTD